MLLLLASLGLAQDDIPLIDSLPPPSPPVDCEGAASPGDTWPIALVEGDAAERLTAHLFPGDVDRDSKERLGTRTDGAIVVHNGTIIYEAYAPGWDADKRHLAWSATKTVMGVLAGIAVDRGDLKTTDSMCDHLSLEDGAQCDVTVEHLLSMTSGLDWRETYEGVSPTASSVLAMLYGEGRGDMARFAAHHPARHAPGQTWYYSSGDTNILSAIVASAVAEDATERFPWTLLFDSIGMTPTWERDGSGTYVGSSYLWATPRDLARFGTVLETGGCSANGRVVSEEWLDRMVAINPASRASEHPGGRAYGWQTWLNQPRTIDPEPIWPNAPTDAAAAMGHWGQSITSIPSLDLVVVRVADDRDRSYSHDTTLMLAAALLEQP